MLRKIIQTLGTAGRESSQSPSDEIIVFHHVPKTAGMSFHNFIENNLSSGSILALYKPDNREILSNLSDQEKAKVSAIVGHLPFSFFAELRFPKPLAHITILREPVSRIVSYYHYIKSSPTHYLHDHITNQNLSLKEFLACRPTAELDNLQVRYLCNQDCWFLPIGSCTEDMLDQAMENLANSFAVVGLIEQFDLTLSMTAQTFGWSNLSSPFINETPRSGQHGQVEASDIADIQSLNQLDLRLYEFAANLFSERAKALNLCPTGAK